MRALVTGATGFIGRQLLDRLPDAVVLSRDAERAKRSVANRSVSTFYNWDPSSGPPPAEALDGVDVVFHLAGESVADGRWTEARKQSIRESRELGTRNLVAGIAAASTKPKAIVSGSAVGYYGSRGDELLDESSPPGSDFLADVCVAWEREAMAAERSGVRVVTARTGVVLGQGGALPKMLLPFKAGVGGKLGSGRQWMPWIHIEDVVDLLVHAAEHVEVSGPMNVVAPMPITNLQFTKALGRVLRRPTLFPVPYLGLRVLFGEFAQVLFASQKVVPKTAQQSGYSFQYTDIETALRHILHGAAKPTANTGDAA